MDRVEAMTAFVPVADLRGFAPAARQLKMSPSAITRLVAALEAHLSIRLLNRTTRSVALTDAGARYLVRARAIVESVRDAEAAARAERGVPSGRFVVSAPLVFGRREVFRLRKLGSQPSLPATPRPSGRGLALSARFIALE